MLTRVLVGWARGSRAGRSLKGPPAGHLVPPRAREPRWAPSPLPVVQRAGGHTSAICLCLSRAKAGWVLDAQQGAQPESKPWLRASPGTSLPSVGRGALVPPPGSVGQGRRAPQAWGGTGVRVLEALCPCPAWPAAAGQASSAPVLWPGAVCSSLWGLPPGSGFLGLRTVPALQSALTPQASRAERGLAARGPLGDPWTRAADSRLPASAPEGLAFPKPLPVALTPKASSGFCRLPVRDEAASHSADLGRGPRFTCGSMGVWLGDLGGRAGAVGPGQWHGRLHAAALGAGHGATARDASVGWRVGRC